MSNIFKVLRPVGDVSVELCEDISSFRDSQKKIKINVCRDIHGLEFIEVYHLYGVRSDGSTNMIASFLTEERVKERCVFFRVEFSDLYPNVYYLKDYVWIY